MPHNSIITKTTPLQDPRFITPIRIHYTQNGQQRSWEAVRSHDSVAILLYHKDKDAFVLVKQLRVTTLLNDPEGEGHTYELCAGIVDKPVSLQQIAKEEVLEECGYDIPTQKLKRVTSYYTSVGFSGAKQTMFYAEIDDSMQRNAGGGIDEEEIEVIYLDVADAKRFMFDESKKKTPGLMMAFYWFFDTIQKKR